MGVLCDTSEFVLNQGRLSGLAWSSISPCLRGDGKCWVLRDQSPCEQHVVGASWAASPPDDGVTWGDGNEEERGA